MAKQDEKKNPVKLTPTPPVGCPVVWYPRGDRANGPSAALVTQVEGLGRVSLTIFAVQSEPVVKKGVNFIDVAEQTPNASQTVRNGGWDFVPGFEPAAGSGVYKLAHEDMDRKEAILAEQNAKGESKLAASST